MLLSLWLLEKVKIRLATLSTPREKPHSTQETSPTCLNRPLASPSLMWEFAEKV